MNTKLAIVKSTSVKVEHFLKDLEESWSLVKNDKIMKNSMPREGLCGFKGFNLGLVVRGPPLHPTLNHDREHPDALPSDPTRALPLNPHGGHNPSTPLGALPPNPHERHCPSTMLELLP